MLLLMAIHFNSQLRIVSFCVSAKLDGTSKPLKPSRTMEDFLQLDEWTPTETKSGKKRVCILYQTRTQNLRTLSSLMIVNDRHFVFYKSNKFY